ncbi:ketopantoate reductase family protein [Planococcus sp. ISL-109]|uniref:ketopantoate reductase family protein n=1 Tax=Planococcus sp. ISL-109 TaxID=2819166 RepID=UPI001BEA3F27|nr:ketopantoate reductase family protein [Planococcus sp. ISL-109]MBT2581410.1 ketopantoate reductase family protein [Planococcus sp. ISL-109]
MRMLMVGAGGIGGYFGARLLEKGEDITFLVREGRKKNIEQQGLRVNSQHGNLHLQPALLTKSMQAEPFDAVLLSTKAYHLEQAIEDIRPFVGEQTMILPLLNGIAHVDKLVSAFGEDAVIGGLCFIETTIGEDGSIVQTSPIHQLVYGERSGERTARIDKLKSHFDDTKAEFVLSENIDQDMWHKYMFITAMSGITSLMESPIGPIRELPSGQAAIKSLLEELEAVMTAIDAPIKHGIASIQLDKVNSMDASMKSSMQRDMEKDQGIEADHLQGHLIEKAHETNVFVPVLETVYTKLKLYEANRNMEK